MPGDAREGSAAISTAVQIDCTHRLVDAFAIANGPDEGKPVDFWACRLCGRRFEPTLTCRCGRPWREHETHYPSKTTAEQDAAAMAGTSR